MEVTADEQIGIKEDAETTEVTAEEAGFSSPFQSREGRTLIWKDVNMTLRGKRDKPEKKILDSVWGQAGNETTAILGPSGAGKTSLLNVLSGRDRSKGRIQVTADVRLDNESVDPTDTSIRKQIAFVSQEDSLQTSATPRECIMFSAKLRLPRTMTNTQLERLTDRMLDELGLTDCADTVTGGELLKGISGGERKRTSVGVELVTKPALVFLDEPTSGLDSFSAVQLIQVLKKVANAGASVLFTIHQPASDIFDTFDRMVLMNKGRVMYQGSVDVVPDYFADRGHPLPPKYNPADWVMIIAQTIPVDELESLGFFPSDDRELPPAETADRKSSHHHRGIRRRNGLRVNRGTEIWWLLKRDFRAMFRDKMILGARMMLTMFMSLLSGCIFWQVGGRSSSEPVNVQSHFGGLLVCTMLSMFGTALPTLIVFPEERPVFIREYATNHYSVLSYFTSRLALEAFLTAAQVILMAIITYFMMDLQLRFFWHFIILYALAMSSTAIAMIIGSSVSDPKLAIEFLPMTLVPQIMFAGFFIAPEFIPVWLRWLQWLMPLTYAVNLILEQEFGQNCGSGEGEQEGCDRILESSNVYSDKVWIYWVALVSIFVVFRLGALILLKRKADK